DHDGAAAANHVPAHPRGAVPGVADLLEGVRAPVMGGIARLEPADVLRRPVADVPHDTAAIGIGTVGAFDAPAAVVGDEDDVDVLRSPAADVGAVEAEGVSAVEAGLAGGEEVVA